MKRPDLQAPEYIEARPYIEALEAERESLWARVVKLADECDEAWGAEEQTRVGVEKLAEALDKLLSFTHPITKDDHDAEEAAERLLANFREQGTP